MKKIKFGQAVVWLHRLPSWYGNNESQEFTGVVLKVFETTVGGRKKVEVAKIAVCKNDYWDKINKATTVIKTEKLNLI